ncbi:hypothetical protein D3C85_1160860 [compost metagenome]
MSVSPSVPLRCSISASPSSTEAGKVVLFRSRPSGLADTVIGATVLVCMDSASVSACATGAISINEHTRGFRVARRLVRAEIARPLSLFIPSFLPFIFALSDVISLRIICE